MENGLYVIIAGAGKVGWNLARELLEKGHEVTCIEQDRRRYLTVEQELEHAVQYGDTICPTQHAIEMFSRAVEETAA